MPITRRPTTDDLLRRQGLHNRAQCEQCARKQHGALASDRITEAASNERSGERAQSDPARHDLEHKDTEENDALQRGVGPERMLIKLASTWGGKRQWLRDRLRSPA